MRDELDVSLETKTNVLTISLLTKEPQLSADILNTIAHELDMFMRTKRTTNASEQRKWIEGRLREVKADLENSENALRDFREKNRRVTDSPQLLLEQERFLREVQINATLFAELKKQYEIAKIEEIKNIPIVNVMDAGRPAAKKEKPKRGIIMLSSFFLSLSQESVLSTYDLSMEKKSLWRKPFLQRNCHITYIAKKSFPEFALYEAGLTVHALRSFLLLGILKNDAATCDISETRTTKLFQI